MIEAAWCLSSSTFRHHLKPHMTFMPNPSTSRTGTLFSGSSSSSPSSIMKVFLLLALFMAAAASSALAFIVPSQRKFRKQGRSTLSAIASSPHACTQGSSRVGSQGRERARAGGSTGQDTDGRLKNSSLSPFPPLFRSYHPVHQCGGFLLRPQCPQCPQCARWHAGHESPTPQPEERGERAPAHPGARLGAVVPGATTTGGEWRAG